MKKKEYVEAKDWMKKAEKLKDRYKSYHELKQHCLKLFGMEYFALLDHPSMNIILIKPEKYVEGGKPENHIVYPPTYRVIENGALKRFNQELIINELAPVLAKHVNRVGLIKDVLYGQTPSELKELHDRIIGAEEKKKKPSIKQRPGCTYLSVGGKPGKPINLFIR